jgi:hypothetical protein
MASVIKATVARSIDGDEYSTLRGVFQRANKAWPWPRMADPERLCKHCVNVMLEVSRERIGKPDQITDAVV